MKPTAPGKSDPRRAPKAVWTRQGVCVSLPNPVHHFLPLKGNCLCILKYSCKGSHFSSEVLFL